MRQRAAILRVRFTDSFLLDIATEGLEAVTTSDKVVEYLSADLMAVARQLANGCRVSLDG